MTSNRSGTIEDYETIIKAVVASPEANVYIFWYDDVPYVAVVEIVDERSWLVLFALDGILESAYVVERPERYLQNEHIVLIDSLKAVMS
ncbi:hypothetical protein KFU94_57480 [Chloroflexi bacterium TSY]|nr:hypothetical protein [Chloroflexi bacterium TSY]